MESVSAHQIPFSPSAVFDRTSARGIRITVRPTLIRLQSCVPSKTRQGTHSHHFHAEKISENPMIRR